SAVPVVGRLIPLLLCAVACSSTAAPPVPLTVRLTLMSSVTVGPGATDLAWTTADPADVGGLWTATQPTRLTVPARWAGRGLELYTGADVIGLTPATETVLLLIRKNGSMTLGVQQATASSAGFGDLALTVW